jgi:hypothetical protein
LSLSRISTYCALPPYSSFFKDGAVAWGRNCEWDSATTRYSYPILGVSRCSALSWHLSRDVGIDDESGSCSVVNKLEGPGGWHFCSGVQCGSRNAPRRGFGARRDQKPFTSLPVRLTVAVSDLLVGWLSIGEDCAIVDCRQNDTSFSIAQPGVCVNTFAVSIIGIRVDFN